ncbi:MAG: HD domain-containing protein [Halioglobus sp.]|nr:HD domain-containing protein [Halioglobus sp.]
MFAAHCSRGLPEKWGQFFRVYERASGQRLKAAFSTKEYILKEIEQTLNFIVEIEKLKDVRRKTKPVGLERFENSAEHSWHVCLAALVLKDFANEAIDIDRVIKMLLIHDLGEIDAGDTIIYASESAELKAEEEAGLERILNMLPEGKTQEYLQLWREFEEGSSADAKYAKSIDRIPPILHNLHGGGHSWRKHSIPEEKILALNSRIELGSESVWRVIKAKLHDAFRNGILR